MTYSELFVKCAMSIARGRAARPDVESFASTKTQEDAARQARADRLWKEFGEIKRSAPADQPEGLATTRPQ
jgi:hypothetical protein